MWGAQSINDEFIIQKHQKTGCFYLKQNEIDASKGTSGAAIFSIYEFNDVNHAVIFGVHTGGKGDDHKHKIGAYNTGVLLDEKFDDEYNSKVTDLIFDYQLKISNMAAMSDAKDNSIWQCVHCTFENQESTTLCEMCGNSKDSEDGHKQWKCISCTFVNPTTATTCNVCGAQSVLKTNEPTHIKIVVDEKKNEMDSLTQNNISGTKINAEYKSLYLSGSKLFNRTYVGRVNSKKEKSIVEYFKHNDENQLEYESKISIRDVNNQPFTPTKVLQYKSNHCMLLLNTNGMNPGNIHVLNLDKGKVIDEWQTKDTIIDIAPLVKHGDMTDSTMIYGINNNSMFQMDERIPNKSKIIDCKQKIHKSIPGFNTISTSGNGFIAVGLKNGKIYMKNSIQRKASTVLPGLGNEIRDIEISDDGYWILATCKDYIMVIPTHVGDTQRTGFEGRGMGKLKPNPYVLRLKYSDIQKYKLKNVDFTAAHFDQGVNINEHWIVSSTGSYIVTWDFDKLKQSGIVNRYSLTRTDSSVVQMEFRFNGKSDLVVLESSALYTLDGNQKKNLCINAKKK
eukprot:79123_1